MAGRTPGIPGATERLVEIDTVDAGRIRVAVQELGEGPPVLMLHGWPEHGGCWAEVAPLMADRYRVICPDLRGFGWSDAPGHGYDSKTFAADQVALLGALGIDRVALVGHDWGGLAGFFLCLDHPELVSAYLVTNTGMPWARRSPAVAAGLLRMWHAAALSVPGLSRYVLTNFPDRFADGLRKESAGAFSPDTAAGYAARLARPETARATVALYRAFFRLMAELALRNPYRDTRLTVPTHFLFGTEDRPISSALVADFEDHGDDLCLELVPGVGHFLPAEAPRLVAERAQELFARVP